MADKMAGGGGGGSGSGGSGQEDHSEATGASLPPPIITRAPFSRTPFAFWTALVFIISLLALLLSSIASSNHLPSFISLPEDLRRHYSAGRLVKAGPLPGTRVFTVEHGPRDADAAVLLVHGLGSSSYSFRSVLPALGRVRAVALDLPGAGFSDTLGSGPSNHFAGVLVWIGGVYRDVREKGIFWGLEHLVVTGDIPEKQAPLPNPASMEVGLLVGSVIHTMGLAPLHLVLHDSAMSTMGSWVSANSHLVRSVTLLDTSTESAAFPARILGAPVLGWLILWSRIAFLGLLKLCCSRTIDGSVSDAYRLMLKGSQQRYSVVAAGRELNYSFDLGEWAAADEMKDVPVQIVWSGAWSDPWIDEGRRVASAVPRAKFSYHYGGRWPQEDASEEIASIIGGFISSLPEYVHPAKEDRMLHRSLDETSQKKDHAEEHIHHHHDHSHDHDHGIGVMNMYGVNRAWIT